jgi:glyoxylase-like metal-dependent hydrolase (beta-lactamase superfamily II)
MVSKIKNEVYCLEYCQYENFPCEVLYNTIGIKGTMTIPLHFTYIKCKDKHILFDTGFTTEIMDYLEIRRQIVGFTPVNYEDPKTLLRKINIDPEQIDYIILNHLHYDHANGIREFPNATLFVQKREIEFLTIDSPQRAFTKAGYNAKDAKVIVLEGDVNIFDGISVYLAPGHTSGCQVCSVETESGHVTLCGDVVLTYRNLDEMIPMRIATDYIAVLNSFAKVKQLSAGNERLIVAGHDMKIFEKFTKIDNRIVKIE